MLSLFTFSARTLSPPPTPVLFTNLRATVFGEKDRCRCQTMAAGTMTASCPSRPLYRTLKSKALHAVSSSNLSSILKKDFFQMLACRNRRVQASSCENLTVGRTPGQNWAHQGQVGTGAVGGQGRCSLESVDLPYLQS